MNKTLKKVLIFLMLVIIVVLVIVIVQMILPNEPAVDSTPSPSATISMSPSPPVTTAMPTASPSPTDDGSVTTEETADGTKYSITVSGSLISYSVVADSTIFEHSRTDGSDTFMDVSEAGEFLSIAFIENGSAKALAPNYLDQFINYNDFEQSGENYIPGTEISGETVTANDGNTQCDAWLVDADKGVLAVVISFNMSKKDDETAKLYKILGTLTIEQ